MALRMFNMICFLRTAVAIGLVAWFIGLGELRGQTTAGYPLAGGGGRATTAPRTSPGATTVSRGSTGTSAAGFGNRQLGRGVPGFASGGAAATRARASAAATGAGGLTTYYADPTGAQPAGGAGLFNPAGATGIAPLATADKAAGQILTPSGSAVQDIGPAIYGAGGIIRPGELAVTFDIDRAPPDQVSLAIAQRLNKLPSLHFLTAVRVDMVGGTAVLRGTVASDHDRDLAARVVLLEASVDRVVNLLVVRKSAVPPPPVPAAPAPGGSTRSVKA